MKSYKVYYINLDKSIQRREFMETQFQKLNIPITRIPAVYGKKIEYNKLKRLKNNQNILAHFPLLNDGEIGLCMTFFKLWEIISLQTEDFAVIIEDDIILSKSFFIDLKNLLEEISINDYLDISGRKGYFSFEKTNYITKFFIPSLSTTGQIVGKGAAKKLLKNTNSFYAPIDVIKQDVYRHKVRVFSTNKKYVIINDNNLGGSTIQQNNMIVWKKVIREIIRPFWQIISLFTYKLQRCIRNYSFYKSN